MKNLKLVGLNKVSSSFSIPLGKEQLSINLLSGLCRLYLIKSSIPHFGYILSKKFMKNVTLNVKEFDYILIESGECEVEYDFN